MKNEYWVCHFANRRQNQLIQIPHDYIIHADFMLLASEEEIRLVFSQLHTLYSQIFKDIEDSPEEFGMPLYLKEEYRNFSKAMQGFRAGNISSVYAVNQPFYLW